MKKVQRQGWKVSWRMLVWLLIISLVMTAFPVLPEQSVAAADLPMQQTTVTKSSEFQDVSPTDWFYDAIILVQEKGIFSGTTASTFSPKGTMTRAMYVTALGRMAGVDTGAYSTSSFADVQVGSWYAPYIEWAVQKGITDGTGAGKYSPDATVSREQMATMTLRYLESEKIPYQTGNSITTKPADLAKVSPWAAEAVVKLWQAGVFTGDEKGNFNPGVQASRAEAAVLFMRNNAVVEAWKSQNPSTVTPTPTPVVTPTPQPTPTVTPSPNPTPSPGGNNGGSGGGGGGGTPSDNNGGSGTPGGNDGGGTPGGNNGGETPGGNGSTDNKIYTLTFNSNGGTAVKAQTVRSNEKLTNLPVPIKEGYIFQGWFTESDLSSIFAEGSTVTADTKLYAKYTDSVENAVQRTPSYSVLNVKPDFTITLQDASGNLSATEVKAGLTFIDTANPDFAGVTVTGGNGLFTVASAAEDGKFVEGNTYQLTLTDENLSFQGQDASTSIYVFSVAKREAMNVPLNANMIYLDFQEVTDMMLNGAEVGSPAIPVITTTVGGSENSLGKANASNGTFKYDGSTPIQVGDTVAIYQGLRPDLRTAETTDADNGDVAYIQITAVNGTVYTYGRASADQVVFRPDVLPVSIEADTDGDPDNNSITIEHTAMNYSDSLYKPFGLNELTTVDVGDFIGFYNGKFAAEGSEVTHYGRITSITSAAEMDIITYKDVTLEDIQNAFNIYQKQAIDGDDLLSDKQISQIEKQIEQQATASGFVNKAADYLSNLAMETEELKGIQQIKAQSSSGKNSRVRVENLQVNASLGTQLKHINGRSSGVSATLQVSADIVVDASEDHDLVIHMTGAFVQEIALDLGINGDMQGHWLTAWGIPYWYSIDDYVITANLDAYSYTGINITAEMGFVEVDKLEAALDNWLDAKTSGKLGQVRDIATEIKAIMDGDGDDSSLDEEKLKEQYQEMLEDETEWVTLIKKTLIEKSKRVAYGIIEVKFEAEFVVSAQVNLSIGADFYYKSAKRYSVTLRILSFGGSSNTVSLPGDGDYQFTFYVMGTIGLRAGIHMELKAGIGSVDLNSIGLAVEPGVYVNLWGFFYYQLKNVSGVQTSKTLGALFIEIGIYLEVEIGAQLGDGMLEDSLPLYENTWPLYTAGMQESIEDFAYPQDDELGVIFRGGPDGASIIDLPQSWLKMKGFDLKTGMDIQEIFDISHFDIQISGDFIYNPEKKQISVKDWRKQSSTGMLVITWKAAPLSFKPTAIKRTIPLNWIKNKDGDISIQFNPMNGEPTETVTAAFNAVLTVKNRIPENPGYTFDGWYTARDGGTKVDIPNRMPAGLSYLYAHWKVNTDTRYRVNYYLMDPNPGKSPTLADWEMQTGTTNELARITSDRYKDRGYMEGTTQGIIKGDGSTILNVNFKPISKTATFKLGYEGASEKQITDLIYTNIVSRIPVPTRQGYKFAGWSPYMPTTMPAESTTFTAKWTAKDDMPYKVVYLKQDIGQPTYTVADTETRYGTTDTKAILPVESIKSYEGFTVDTAFPGTVLEANIVGNGTTVLRVYYKRNMYKLTMDYKDQSTPKKVVDNVPYGSTTSIHIGDPIWQGHQFKGWSPVPQATMPAQDIEYTAKWDIEQYIVSFNSNGGAEEVPDQMLDYGAMASEPESPTRKDYTFGGWYSDSALTKPYNFAMPVVSPTTLYAKWMSSYTISFDSNEGSMVPDQTVYGGEKATAPKSPTREGYVFAGWFSDTGLTKGYNFTTEIVKGNITLYAKWTIAQKNEYTVRFYETSAALLQQQRVKEGGVAESFEPEPREGYTFLYWRDKDTPSKAFDFTTPITRNHDLYTAWQTNKYEVIFMSDGTKVSSQSVNYKESAKVPSMPTREGYVFKGWYTDTTLTNAYNFGSQVVSPITLYAKWAPMFTVSFDSKGGSAVNTQTMEYNAKATAPASPTRTGYVFGGWYSNEDLTDVYNFASPVTTNVTLHAKWTPLFTVNFDLKGGTSVVDPKTLVEGSLVATPAEPVREGYVFGGWYSDEGLTTVYDFATPVTSNITLYAKWKALYTVTFRVAANGPEQLIKKIVVEGETVSPPDTSEMPSNPGQMVYGWTKNSVNLPYYDFSTPVTENFWLAVKWGLAYTVTFESNGGSEVSTYILKGTDLVEEPEPPVRPGFVFDGWYRNEALTGAFVFGSQPRSQNITLYAKWTEL
ncbi:InlB B-repeat-containing protein [Paenibacillus xylanexedens]|uniref:InlB B-repeat-containing protein n=1 Tax=Paenibacillus xylanexedens TaxID=528191 RepID=UPI001643F982|nr:InlB B-repeat-containing protein [Paenibacillus xylanexedens]